MSDDSQERLSTYLVRSEAGEDPLTPIALDLSRVSREALEALALAAIMFDDMPGFPAGPVSEAIDRVHKERTSGD